MGEGVSWTAWKCRVSSHGEKRDKMQGVWALASQCLDLVLGDEEAYVWKLYVVVWHWKRHVHCMWKYSLGRGMFIVCYLHLASPTW
jgi:hypothetical protein